MIHMASSKNIMTAQEQVEIVQRREKALFDREKPLFGLATAGNKHIDILNISKPTILEIGLERNRISKTPRIATQKAKKGY